MIAALALVTGVFAGLSPSSAQPSFRSLPNGNPAATDASRKQLELKKRRALESGLDSPEAQKDFFSYYVAYVLPTMSRPDDAAEWPRLRNEFLKDYEAADPKAQLHFLKFAHRYFSGLATNAQFYPAARANATLLLGDISYLNKERSGPPIPVPQFTAVLEGLVKKDGEHEAVRAAALRGLVRHVRLRAIAPGKSGLQLAEKNRLRDLALAEIAKASPPTGRSKAAHDYCRRMFVEILEALRDPGENGKVAEALVALAADENADATLRCQAVRAIAPLQFEADKKPAPEVVARAVGRLVAELLEDEVRELAITARSNSFGGPIRPNEPGFDEPQDGRKKLMVVADERTRATRRRLMERLLVLQAAIKGNSTTRAPGLDKAYDPSVLADSDSAITKALELARDIEMPLEKLGSQLEELQHTLEDEFPPPRDRDRGRDRDEDEQNLADWR